eukprot:Polyplicarium_translucidae@DN617_c0_g1_i1.p2
MPRLRAHHWRSLSFPSCRETQRLLRSVWSGKLKRPHWDTHVPHWDINCIANVLPAPPVGSALPEILFVVYLGGCTYSEVAAIRRLAMLIRVSTEVIVGGGAGRSVCY